MKHKADVILELMQEAWRNSLMNAANTKSYEDRTVEMLKQAKDLNLGKVLAIITRLDEELSDTKKELDETKEKLEWAEKKLAKIL
jgi:hypothetical protein